MKNKKKLLSAILPVALSLILFISLIIISNNTLAWFNRDSEIDIEQDIMGFWFNIILDEGNENTVVQGTRNINIGPCRCDPEDGPVCGVDTPGAFPIADPCEDYPIPPEFIYNFAVRNGGNIGVNLGGYIAGEDPEPDEFKGFEVNIVDSPVPNGAVTNDVPLSRLLRFSIRTAYRQKYSLDDESDYYVHCTIVDNSPRFGDWRATEAAYKEGYAADYVICRDTGENLLQVALNEIIHPLSADSVYYWQLPSIFAIENRSGEFYAIAFEIAIWLADSARLDDATYVYNYEQGDGYRRYGKTSNISLSLHVRQNPALR